MPSQTAGHNDWERRFFSRCSVFGFAVDRIDRERTAEAAALTGCADAIGAKVPADAL